MRILVVGAGATGGYFGGRLVQAGRDVTFLVREGRARTLRERGLRIVGLGEQTVLEPELVTADAIEGPYDLVLLTVKESGLTGAVDDLAPAVGPDTLIVPVLNGMRQIDVLVERFGEQAVLGGIAYVMTTIDADGDILRLAGMHRLTYGRRDGSVDDKVRAVHAALSDAGFDTALSERILSAMWSKWTFIASLGAVCVLGGGTVGEVAGLRRHGAGRHRAGRGRLGRGGGRAPGPGEGARRLRRHADGAGQRRHLVPVPRPVRGPAGRGRADLRRPGGAGRGAGGGRALAGGGDDSAAGAQRAGRQGVGPSLDAPSPTAPSLTALHRPLLHRPDR